jgi:hypothetical protein
MRVPKPAAGIITKTFIAGSKYTASPSKVKSAPPVYTDQHR